MRPRRPPSANAIEDVITSFAPSRRLAGQISVRLCSDSFAYASIVADGWSIRGIAVRLREDGPARIDWPTTEGKGGAKWPVVTPPPALREQLEHEIAEAVVDVISRGGSR